MELSLLIILFQLISAIITSGIFFDDLQSDTDLSFRFPTDPKHWYDEQRLTGPALFAPLGAYALF